MKTKLKSSATIYTRTDSQVMLTRRNCWLCATWRHLLKRSMTSSSLAWKVCTRLARKTLLTGTGPSFKLECSTPGSQTEFKSQLNKTALFIHVNLPLTFLQVEFWWTCRAKCVATTAQGSTTASTLAMGKQKHREPRPIPASHLLRAFNKLWNENGNKNQGHYRQKSWGLAVRNTEDVAFGWHVMHAVTSHNLTSAANWGCQWSQSFHN